MTSKNTLKIHFWVSPSLALTRCTQIHTAVARRLFLSSALPDYSISVGSGGEEGI